MSEPEKCVDCALPAPASSVDTSMLARLGWRVSRKKEASGRDIVQIRCPACWKLYRDQKP
jgi:hypothetical protein